ncbi:hypothetical protein JHK87_022477 [Glycine soja]|nr:hypothetical protein JHK87_022477 [Glycine soja]
MLLALRPDKFANSLCKKPLVAWTSCVNEPKATSRWKKCSDSEMKSDKLDKSMTSKKEAPRTYSHKLNKRHKLDKRQPLPKRPRKTLNELGAIVYTSLLKIKFPTLTGEIMIVKADQKQARQCCAESLKVAPYPPTREPVKPHPTTDDTNQVMSVDKGPPQHNEHLIVHFCWKQGNKAASISRICLTNESVRPNMVTGAGFWRATRTDRPAKGVKTDWMMNENTDVGVSEVPLSQKTVTEPKIIMQTRSKVDLLDDGYRWRKYGQKVMKRHHEEELTKLKADHDQLEARVRRPQGDKQSAQTLLERTQGESHP